MAHLSGLPPLRQKKAWLFDLDGTLVDTSWEYIRQCVVSTIRHLGGRPQPERMLLAFWYAAKPRSRIIAEDFQLPVEAFWDTFNSFDIPQQRFAHTDLIEDCLPALQELQRQRKLIGVITAAVPAIAEVEIGIVPIRFDIMVSVSRNPGFATKPDPQSLYYACQKLHLSPEAVVYVGDSGEDREFAGNAGVDFVHFQRNGQLKGSLHPAAVFTHWRDFAQIL